MAFVARNPLIARDLDLQPYSADESRVCDYLQAVAPDIGCGDDPIGFLIASHATLAAGRRCDPRFDLTFDTNGQPVLSVADRPRAPLGGDPMRPQAAPLHCGPLSGGDPRLPPGRHHP